MVIIIFFANSSPGVRILFVSFFYHEPFISEDLGYTDIEVRFHNISLRLSMKYFRYLKTKYGFFKAKR